MIHRKIIAAGKSNIIELFNIAKKRFSVKGELTLLLRDNLRRNQLWENTISCAFS
jgi:hypothetical protein